MVEQKVSVKLSKRLRDFLTKNGLKNESYDEVIWRLLGQKELTKEQAKKLVKKFGYKYAVAGCNRYFNNIKTQQKLLDDIKKRETELEKELKKIDKHYGKKLDRLYEQSLGRSKEAREIKKEWIEKAIKIENELKKRNTGGAG